MKKNQENELIEAVEKFTEELQQIINYQILMEQREQLDRNEDVLWVECIECTKLQ